MPLLDRRVAITFDTGGTTSDQGRYTPANTTVNVWAHLRGLDTRREVEVGGTRPSGVRVYRVRYDRRLLATVEGGRAATVVDDGYTQNVVGVSEPEMGRRRYLDLACEGGSE